MGIAGEITKRMNELDSLSFLSPAAIEILNIIDRPHTSLQAITDLILLDQVLYANIMKYTKSAAFTLRRSPITLEEAINYLGLYGLRDLIFFIAARRMSYYPDTWYQNVFRAFCAKKLAQKMGLEPKQVSNIYIAALMYDFGGIELSYQILLDCNLPEVILNIIKTQSLDWQESNYQITNSLIDMANQLTFLEYADEYDLDELMSQPKYIKFNLRLTELNAYQVRKMHHDIKDLIEEKF